MSKDYVSNQQLYEFFCGVKIMTLGFVW